MNVFHLRGQTFQKWVTHFWTNLFYNFSLEFRQFRAHLLECRKWGFKRWGFKEIRGYLRKKALFLRFLDFPGVFTGPPEKGERGRKRAKKADFGRFSERAARHPLSPPFVTPPFAAAQIWFFFQCHSQVRGWDTPALDQTACAKSCQQCGGAKLGWVASFVTGRWQPLRGKHLQQTELQQHCFFMDIFCFDGSRQGYAGDRLWKVRGPQKFHKIPPPRNSATAQHQLSLCQYAPKAPIFPRMCTVS